MNKFRILSALIFLVSCSVQEPADEDGSRLWLPGCGEGPLTTQVSCNVNDITADVAVREIEANLHAWSTVSLIQEPSSDGKCGSYRIKSSSGEVTVTAPDATGLLYGAYALLRLQDTGADLTDLDITQIPAYDIRILNHWDNPDGNVERGYAGTSLWQWDELPDQVSPRYEQYARANASVGINAVAVNNVNASPLLLTREYLEKVKVLAGIFRKYGIRTYLSVNFASPKHLGGLTTSDPLNPEVSQWWKRKADEIYGLIPDFGGFLVKANSEGQSGPQDYGRTHADGANMLARALKPHGGVVMWRAFVYAPDSPDRASQAYEEFVPLDGQFDDNVIIQIKNGPVDFQPREPFSPLFGAAPHTAQMVEFQITQEYLGFSNHLVFLAPMWKECLDADTYRAGEGTTVSDITLGKVWPRRTSAIAGVANTGSDVNWCGHIFAQANWYAFGRLAWDPSLTSEQIAREWLLQTFPAMRARKAERKILPSAIKMLCESREAAVDYMMPLGLHHIFATVDHYGPEPWSSIPWMRSDWQPPYYHKADSAGLGFDRTETGSGNVACYAPPLCKLYNDIGTCPENLILWFHHVPWDYRMKNGETMWDALCHHYQTGMDRVEEFLNVWDACSPYVDECRWEAVKAKLDIQRHDALWWRDACLLYFQTFSGMPFPDDVGPIVYDLDTLKKSLLYLQNRPGFRGPGHVGNNRLEILE